MSLISTISLEGMEFYAYHGCYETERVVGNRFEVNLWVDADVSVAAQNDSLQESINYLHLYNIVEREMMKTSHIVENVAHRIVTAIHSEIEGISHVKIQISKLAPPTGGKISKVCITYSK